MDLIEFVKEHANFRTYFLFKVILLATVWTLAIQAFTPAVEQQAPLVQFAVSTLFFYVLFGVVLGRFSADDGVGIKEIFGGAALAASLDNLIPPLSVNLAGVLTSGPVLQAAAIDTQLFYLWHTLVGEGLLLFILVYPVSSFLLLTLAAFLLSRRELSEHLGVA